MNKTAGDRWPRVNIGSKPLKTSAEIAAAAERVKTAEKFPTNLKEASVLLREVSATEVKSQEDWEAIQPRLLAIKLHVRKLQQGLPVLETKSTDKDISHLTAAKKELKLAHLIQENPRIAELLA